MLEALATAGAATDNVAIDATYVKLQRSAEKGSQSPENWPLARRNTTKIHALTDVIDRPFRLLLTPSNIHDVTAAPDLLAQLKGARYVLGDKGYDSDALWALMRKQGSRPVIPGKANRKRKIPLDKDVIGHAISSKTPSADSKTLALFAISMRARLMPFPLQR
jgi:transposase